MFTSARIRLTAWYLGILMCISILFSISIYTVITRQIEGFIHMQNDRVEHFHFASQPDGDNHPKPPVVSTKELEDQERQLLYTLLSINIGIFFIAGGSAYFLAGRTLRPIKLMMDEQARFVSDASHELKTPLSAMRVEMEVYLMEKGHTVQKSDEIITSSLEEVINLQSLSENLMQLTKYENNNSNLMKKVSLLDVVENALKKVIPLAREKKIKIINNVGEEIIGGDQHALTSLFVILLDNAISYSPQEKTIEISSKKQDKNVLIEIVDQGIGIEEKDIPHIFDRFYRADISRTKQSVNGHGLGLSIAKKIVDNHKGTIFVKSTQDKGTTFSIVLPHFKH